MRILISTILSICIVFSSYAQDSIQYHYLEEIVSYLASDSLKGRATGSDEEVLAADFIFMKFKEIDRCKVKHQKFQFTQDSVNYKSQNIIAYINNKSKKTIILSAHYDHLGFGGVLSQSKGIYKIHNGADDNASGVALLLNLAQDLSLTKGNYNYLFIAHSGHELGLHGSKHFSENLKRKYKNIHLFVNFDMVGRLNSEKKLYYDYSKNMEDSLKFPGSNILRLSKSTHDRINTLDTKWFVVKQIPSITFSTGHHIDYHKVSDDVEYIDFNGIVTIEEFLITWLKSLSP